MLPFIYAGVDPFPVIGRYLSLWVSDTGWASRSSFEIARYTTAMLLTGLAGVIAFRSKVWNIGLEGYMILGAIGTAAAAYAGLHWALQVVASMLFGVLWALPVALLLVTGVSEIVSSMMMYYVSLYMLQYVVYKVWPSRYGLFPKTPEWGVSQPIVAGFPLMLVVGILLCFVVNYLYHRTMFGVVARLVGSNEKAARTAGYSPRLVRVVVLLLSSGLAGLAGFHVASLRGYLSMGYASLGYGFAGITVAFIAGLNPLAVPISALFVALLYHFGSFASDVIPGGYAAYFYYVQGVLLLVVLAARTIPSYRIIVRVEKRHG
ncbi:ABC transporter permease [Pyrolobus fumarii]|uniref:ABC transporter permease n=1 Tax=Pyrolobus fumarii TaxID=54252 RepID=UPI001432DACC|nr:ABC transporter permease [Pyrolobus fumarii]